MPRRKLTTATAPHTYGHGDMPTPPKVQFGPLAGPVVFCAATTKGTYSQAHEWRNAALRPGCMDFLRHRSRGF